MSGNTRLALRPVAQATAALGLAAVIAIGFVTASAAEDPGQSTSPTPTAPLTPTATPPSTEVPSSTEVPLPSVMPTVITSPTQDGTFTPSPLPATTSPPSASGTDLPVIVDAGGGPGGAVGRPGWLWAFPVAFLLLAAYAWSRAFAVGRPER